MKTPKPGGATPPAAKADDMLIPAKGVGGHGSSGNGLAHITLGDQGLVQKVELDPRIRTLDSHDLADCIREAILAAQRDYGSHASETTATVDGAKKIYAQLAEIDVQYRRQLDEFEPIMDDIVRRLTDGTGPA